MLSRIDVIFSKEDVETHFHIYEPRYAKMQTYAAPVIYGALTIMHGAMELHACDSDKA